MLNATRVKKGLGVRRERNPISSPVFKLSFKTNEKGERVLESAVPVTLFQVKPSKQYPSRY